MMNAFKRTPVLFYMLSFFYLHGELASAAEMLSTENTTRQWCTSLDVYWDNRCVLPVDQWLQDNQNFIHAHYEAQIRRLFSKKTPVQQNIAIARFTIIYHQKGDIQYHTFDLNKLFISGLSFLDPNHKEVREQHLQDFVIFPISFIPGARPVGKEINRIQKDKINSLLSKEVVSSGTHAEGSMLLHLNNLLMHELQKISTHDFVIIGTILEVSSLKDPCSDVCVPMLQEFMEKLPEILRKNLPKNARVAEALENLTLLSGRYAHIQSRDGMIIQDAKIILNFDAPKNRIYSRKYD